MQIQVSFVKPKKLNETCGSHLEVVACNFFQKYISHVFLCEFVNFFLRAPLSSCFCETITLKIALNTNICDSNG